MNRITSTDLKISKKLISAREESGIKITAFSSLIGVTHQQLRKYENGQNRISAGRLVLFAAASGKPITYFFSS